MLEVGRGKTPTQRSSTHGGQRVIGMPGEGQLLNPKASGPQWVQGLRENFPEEVAWSGPGNRQGHSRQRGLGEQTYIVRNGM